MSDIKFETINGQLCRMVEPTPLTLDSNLPCVVRYIQDDSPMGRYLKRKYYEVINTVIEINRIGFDNRVYSSDKTFIEEIECLEIIGYPVVEGSAEWALYQMMQGKNVASSNGTVYWQDKDDNDLIKYTDGYGQIWIQTPYMFLRCVDASGWQIYKEPKPEQPREPEYVICKRCAGSQSVPNPVVSITAYTTCPKCGGTGYEIEPEPEPKFKVGDWVEYGIDGSHWIVRESTVPDMTEMVSIDTGQVEWWDVKQLGIFRKLSPSEVRVKITLEGQVTKPVDNAGGRFWLYYSADEYVSIELDALSHKDRELVESLLEAQEEEKK